MEDMKVPEGAPLIGAPGQHPQLVGPQIMGDLDTIIVKQKPDYLESLTGCQIENKPTSEYEGQIGKEFFKCRESSDCYKRTCLSPDCRPFEVGVYKTGPAEGPFLRFEREYAYTCFCLNRPEMKIFHTEQAVEFNKKGKIEKSDSDVYLGKVTDPWECCGLRFNVYDEHNTQIYQIYGKCCQCGLFCKCPCGPCQKVEFDILDQRKDICGKIENIWAGCCKETYSTANNFIAHLPVSASWKEKSILLGAVLFIDFQNFEKQNKNNRNHG